MRSSALMMSAALAVTLPAAAEAVVIDWSGFLQPDGAITTMYHGDGVDPYFALKALLVASDNGADIRAAGTRFVEWMLARQRANGLFERYRHTPEGWVAVAQADADDALLALWMDMLHRLERPATMPASWKQSLLLAEGQLARLYDPSRGIYLISERMPVGLLMDNTEIYGALRSVAASLHRAGKLQESAAYSQQADKLASAILNVFRKAGAEEFLVSTQPRSETHFYPDRVAQIYPLYHGVVNPAVARHWFAAWMSTDREAWLARRDVDFPWGLVAIVALHLGDEADAFCWQNRAEPLRYSQRWNVLEEIARQLVLARLQQHTHHSIACVTGDSR